MLENIQLRRGTAAAWLAANPILLLGEPGLEIDTTQFKMGDGATTWALLPYMRTANQLGRAKSAANFNITSTRFNYTGLTVPVTVPAGVDLCVRAYLPWIQCNTGVASLFATGIAGINLELWLTEDNVDIQSSVKTFAVNEYGYGICELDFTPVAGPHTYGLSAQLIGGGTATSSALVTAPPIVPYIKVSVV